MKMADSAIQSKLTDAQKAKVERNRQRAILLRQSRLANHPYKGRDDNASHIVGTKMLDTGGGFMLEEPGEGSSKSKRPRNVTNISYGDPPLLPPETHMCDECGKPFEDSLLWNQFEVSVCEKCRDEDEKWAYITKTDAKTEYLLKDIDLDKREPILKFIVRKNPHNPRWGDMKLFLKCQVYQRAMDIWGSEEELEDARTQRRENREKQKIKQFNKTMKNLRMAVRSSTYTKDLSGHSHVYGPEIFNRGDDCYIKTCQTCGQSITYEKM